MSRTRLKYVPSRRAVGTTRAIRPMARERGRRRECPSASRSSAPAYRTQLPQILDEVYAEGSREGRWDGICDL